MTNEEIKDKVTKACEEMEAHGFIFNLDYGYGSFSSGCVIVALAKEQPHKLTT